MTRPKRPHERQSHPLHRVARFLSKIEMNPTGCPKGHPYDQENTRMKGNKRDCRQCERDRQQVKRQTKGLR